MPFVLIGLGVLLLAAAVRGKAGELIDLAKEDFAGEPGFAPWFIVLFLIGALGYYKPLEAPTRAFLGLLILVILLVNSQRGNVLATLINTFSNVKPVTKAGAPP